MSNNKNSSKDQNDKKRNKAIEKGVKKVVKKCKKSKKISLILITIVVVIIVAVLVTYVVKPTIFKDFIDQINSLAGGGGDKKSEGSTVGNTPIVGDKLEMTVVNVGQGDCIYITFPDGKNMLMDCGNENGTTSAWTEINAFLVKKQVTTIDYFFITHTDYDHIREGKNIFDNYEVRQIYLPKIDFDIMTKTWKVFGEKATAETHIENDKSVKSEIKYNVGNFSISGKDWNIDCFSFSEKDYPKITDKSSAEDKNSVSPICFLKYAGRTIVLTGDANFTTEEYQLKNGSFDNIDADVLKVGHHGSESSTSADFLNKIDVEYAIISTNGKSYGHPTPQLLTRLREYADIKADSDANGIEQFACTDKDGKATSEVYRTDKDGNVTVQVGADGTLNLNSQNNDTRNRTVLVTVKMTFSNGMTVTLFAHDGKRESL